LTKIETLHGILSLKKKQAQRQRKDTEGRKWGKKQMTYKGKTIKI
jgi:hypothetical protein